MVRATCKNCHKRFIPVRASAEYCSGRCRVAAHRARHARPPATLWFGKEPRFSTAPSRIVNADGTPALSRAELGERLIEIAERDDGGEPKTGRRFYYLAISYGYVQPDMSATEEGKKSRDAAYDRVIAVLGILRKQGRLDWEAVLDLTREFVEWEVYNSPREARAAIRRRYDEDRWFGQPYFPIFIVEKDTMVPVCEPMAGDWQMKFASSRGYGSLKLQYDTARKLSERLAKHPDQRLIVYFISDLDPSGLDLQRSWEDALFNFNLSPEFIRIGLTRDQVRALRNPRLRQGIEVKPGDSRAESYMAEYGDRCWETDILPAATIRQALDRHIGSWLDAKLWKRRAAEIERARALL
jgi:hypothetical protein